jgi:hypothetical protein
MNSTTESEVQLNSTSIVATRALVDDTTNQQPTSHPYVVGTALIVKSSAFFFMMIVSLFGNGLVLTAIRTTPSFWTKTNKILASLTVADMAAGFGVTYYVPYTLITSVFNNPCRYNIANVATRWLFMLPPYAASFNLIVVAVDRYVAVVHPLQYETKMTDRVVNWMIAIAWFAGLMCAMGNVMWLINADLTKCVIIPIGYNFMDTAVYALVAVTVLFVYVRLLFIAWRQYVAIGLITAGASTSGPESAISKNSQVRHLKASESFVETGNDTEYGLLITISD